ncbi:MULTISPECIES: holo-ACP synthase [Gordonia]|uniref:Holo-[acyl-carrier-protein] synthase n=1 Tax=Gordonia sputi NBRC 100414 TaxID=1089453 RepID=H5U693_9ACTN|nr:MULTISPECIES: holo-ACP synthase [Gordonia]NKY92219.1 holo-ACP synthase [Gordonia sputi]OBA65967.1 ACP synthase [Gordonia sp. 852002-10350_SCH5691597]GAB41251.1 holo-[acyl-carrier-protein] synthase [Gordonia sputi NBRC 100414]
MSFVVGCDLVDVAEIVASIDTFGDRYLRRVFTDAELVRCEGPTRAQRLAARFAAKESVIKTLIDSDAATPLREIEVVMNGPVPGIRLSGSMAALAERKNWREPSLSLSHTSTHAMATVIAHIGV